MTNTLKHRLMIEVGEGTLRQLEALAAKRKQRVDEVAKLAFVLGMGEL